MKPALPTTIDHILEEIRAELNLSRETEQELLAELRSHLEDTVAAAAARGENEEAALLKAAEQFGAAEVGRALQDVHAQWESADAILACALPVAAALLLRWLVFAPQGTAVSWQTVLIQPAFWIVALVVLLLPALKFHRWGYALACWGFFWVMTVLFAVMPGANAW